MHIVLSSFPPGPLKNYLPNVSPCFVALCVQLTVICFLLCKVFFCNMMLCWHCEEMVKWQKDKSVGEPLQSKLATVNL